MTKIEKTVPVVFIEHNGIEHKVDAKVGASVMQAAVNNLIPGIEADCGGLCACATCHAYIDGAWSDKINPISSGESDLLSSAPRTNECSRLSCQIPVTEAMAGIVIRLPESQY